MNKNKIYFLVIFFVAFFTLVLFSTNKTKADVNKKITITFATSPSSATASIAQLKYNKNFAFSYSFDDGLIAGYDPAFKYMNGGYSSYLGQYFSGLYFTDGAGNNVPFRGGYAFYTRNSSYSDIHVNTPSYINWTQLQDASDYGWDIFNHGYTSASVPANDPNHVYYVGDPGGHAQGPLDYAYELNRMAAEVASHINLKNNAGSTTVPFPVTQVILPNGDGNYIQPAFDNNFKTVYAQRADYTFDGSTVTSPEYVNVNNPISSNRHVMKRWFDYETRYLTGGEYPDGLFNKVDELASISTGTNKYWGQEFTHQITTSTYSGDWNGGITWNTWKSLMDHVENTYGRFGNDKAWVAGAEEVYDYMMVKQNTNLIQTLNGNQLTIELDTTNVPTSLRHYALSLLINSDAQISTITYGTDFTYHSDNKSTGLINVDWGVNSYSKNDITRVEGFVSAAESARSLSSINTARTYVNLLNDTQQSVEKLNFNTRLDAIVVPLRTWYIKIRGDFTTTASANSYSSTSTTFSPSVFNWNKFGVVKDSTVTPVSNDLVNMKDSDGLVSTISLSNTAPFKFGSLSSASTGNNSGIYPDAVIGNGAQVYAASTTPAKILLYGLDNAKNYNIKLFGYTSNTSAADNSATTQYTIGGVVKELIVKSNISQTSDFTGIYPTNGEIEITINPKVAAWGYGLLNAMVITENLLPAPTNFSYTSPNVYTKNSAIASLTPTITGNEITYSISPSLPTGLSLNTSTGAISGTPTVVTATSYYTVTATNTGGSTNFPVSITINDIAPTSLSYTTPNTFTKGVSINSLSPSVSGGAVVEYSVSPSLPAGLTLDTSTGIISGTPTISASQNTYIITAVNSGGESTFAISIVINESAPTNLSYTSPNIFTKNSAITPLSPTIDGSGLTYSVSPSLPTGLSLDTSTGVISGTPTIVVAESIYTVTATNVAGSINFEILISVNDIAPSNLSYTSQNIFTKNSAITSLSPTVTGNIISYSISPSLPAGLALDTSTGIISGTPTATSSQNTYIITATNSGGSTNFSITVTVNPSSSDSLILSDIFISSLPTKINYSIGETLDIDGLVVKGIYEGQSNQVLTITTGNISGFSSGTSGSKILTITYEGKTATYLINVIGSSSSSSGSGYRGKTNVLNTVKNPIISVSNTEAVVSTANNPIVIKNKTPFVFTKNLQIGSKNKEVLELQKYLNNHGFIITQKGNGSPGSEINYFGKATKEALGKFQLENGIITKKMSKSYGVFGPATRRFVNSHE